MLTEIDVGERMLMMTLLLMTLLMTFLWWCDADDGSYDDVDDGFYDRRLIRITTGSIGVRRSSKMT